LIGPKAYRTTTYCDFDGSNFNADRGLILQDGSQPDARFSS
jgi:hypothetical protein